MYTVWEYYDDDGAQYEGAITKTYSLSNITDGKSGKIPLIKLNNIGSYRQKWYKGKGTTIQWNMSIHGNKIEAWLDGRCEYRVQAEDNEFAKGGYGFFTISQPTNFLSIKINTTKSLTLQEIIAKTTWKSDETNIIVNFNNQREDEISTQACVDAFNSKDIHYEQITTSANASDVNTFLSKIGNRGKYVESSNYNTYMSQLTDYITTYVRNNTK